MQLTILSFLAHLGTFFDIYPEVVPAPTVTIRNGTLKGLRDATYNHDLFLGIPYAQPPTGKRRFRAPESYDESWTGSRDATAYGFSCPGMPLLRLTDRLDTLYPQIPITSSFTTKIVLLSILRDPVALAHHQSSQSQSGFTGENTLKGVQLYPSTTYHNWFKRPNSYPNPSLPSPLIIDLGRGGS
jgi:hypothetical protein